MAAAGKEGYFLPNELWFSIFSYLNLQELFVIRLVSKNFQNIATELFSTSANTSIFQFLTKLNQLEKNNPNPKQTNEYEINLENRDPLNFALHELQQRINNKLHFIHLKSQPIPETSRENGKITTSLIINQIDRVIQSTLHQVKSYNEVILPETIAQESILQIKLSRDSLSFLPPRSNELNQLAVEIEKLPGLEIGRDTTNQRSDLYDKDEFLGRKKRERVSQINETPNKMQKLEHDNDDEVEDEEEIIVDLNYSFLSCYDSRDGVFDHQICFYITSNSQKVMNYLEDPSFPIHSSVPLDPVVFDDESDEDELDEEVDDEIKDQLYEEKRLKKMEEEKEKEEKDEEYKNDFHLFDYPIDGIKPIEEEENYDELEELDENNDQNYFDEDNTYFNIPFELREMKAKEEFSTAASFFHSNQPKNEVIRGYDSSRSRPINEFSNDRKAIAIQLFRYRGNTSTLILSPILLRKLFVLLLLQNMTKRDENEDNNSINNSEGSYALKEECELGINCVKSSLRHRMEFSHPGDKGDDLLYDCNDDNDDKTEDNNLIVDMIKVIGKKMKSTVLFQSLFYSLSFGISKDVRKISKYAITPSISVFYAFVNRDEDYLSRKFINVFLGRKIQTTLSSGSLSSTNWIGLLIEEYFQVIWKSSSSSLSFQSLLNKFQYEIDQYRGVYQLFDNLHNLLSNVKLNSEDFEVDNHIVFFDQSSNLQVKKTSKELNNRHYRTASKKVNCPICGKEIKESTANLHIDECLNYSAIKEFDDSHLPPSDHDTDDTEDIDIDNPQEILPPISQANNNFGTKSLSLFHKVIIGKDGEMRVEGDKFLLFKNPLFSSLLLTQIKSIQSNHHLITYGEYGRSVRMKGSLSISLPHLPKRAIENVEMKIGECDVVLVLEFNCLSEGNFRGGAGALGFSFAISSKSYSSRSNTLISDTDFDWKDINLDISSPLYNTEQKKFYLVGEEFDFEVVNNVTSFVHQAFVKKIEINEVRKQHTTKNWPYLTSLFDYFISHFNLSKDHELFTPEIKIFYLFQFIELLLMSSSYFNCISIE